MKMQRWCNITELNWATIPDLKSHIERLGVEVRSEEVTLRRAPDTITYESLQAGADAVREHGAPLHYTISINGKNGTKSFRFYVNRGASVLNSQNLYITIEGIDEAKSLDALTEFLGFVPLTPVPARRALGKTVFIAHRFDEHGGRCAERVARFLELLGFTVVTGKTFSPRSISEKVRGRIAEQELLFAILTPGTDNTWLTQEPIVAESADKPLFLLKQTDYSYTAGLLGNREYIPFPPESVEATFISILEGLHDLGYIIGPP